jgi:hypothetical protein
MRFAIAGLRDRRAQVLAYNIDRGDGMFRRLAGILVVCGATGFCQNADEARGSTLTTEFQKSVIPVLSARCTGCHSAQLKSGNLNLEQFRNASLAPPQIEI